MKRPPRENFGIEKKIQALQTDLQPLVSSCELGIKPNITRAERNAILDLRSREDTIITKSDKWSEPVVMNESHLKPLCTKQLTDTSTYKN